MENSWIATTIRHGVVSCEEKINQLLFKCLLATDLLATDLWQRIYGNGFMATDIITFLCDSLSDRFISKCLVKNKLSKKILYTLLKVLNFSTL